MTNFERSQPRNNFTNAGRRAYGMMISAGSNPYPPNSPQYKSWLYGWRQAQDRDTRVHRPFVSKPHTSNFKALRDRMTYDRPRESGDIATKYRKELRDGQ